MQLADIDHDFGILLANGAERRFATMRATSPGKAADMAERQVNEFGGGGFTAIAVTLRLNIVGRCGRCKHFLFEGDHAREASPGKWKCFEC